MTTYHIYKTDCTKASRVLLQSSWERLQSVFIHEMSPSRGPAAVPELPYKLKSVIQALTQSRGSQDSIFVFHAQSSLPLLLIAYILRFFLRSDRNKFVYDIHDLHERRTDYRNVFEKIRYGIIRHYCLSVLERIALKLPGVETMTVSEGIGNAITERYRCRAPKIVHSARRPQLTETQLKALPRINNALLFFGTPERLPIELIDPIGRAGLELHIYGRFQDQQDLELVIGRQLPEFVKFFGQYSPDELDFIGRYNYLILYKPKNVSINFQYSLPNKLFQSLNYGLSLIVSENFKATRELLSSIPGAAFSIQNPVEIVAAIEKAAKKRPHNFYARCIDTSQRLHDRARDNYLKITTTTKQH